MALSSKKQDEIRIKVEKHTTDPDRRELLIKLINNNPNLENLLLNMNPETIDEALKYKTGSPSHTSSSPVGTRKINSFSNFSSGSPFSSSSSPIGINNTTNYTGSKKGCFIATAAFGSPFEENVLILKSFRDHYLQKTKPGRLFINYYYRLSPKVSIFISGKPYLKKTVRALLLPLVWICKQLNY